MGGAPANFTYHSRSLGADARVLSQVGRDAPGHDLLAALGALSIPTDGVAVDSGHPTGTVTVEMDAQGQHAFTIHEAVAWDFLASSSKWEHLVAEADAVCFGSLAQRSPQSRDTIAALLSHASTRCLRVFDVNLRQHYFSQEVIEHALQLANVLKLNDAELPVIAPMLGLKGDVRGQIQLLAQRFDLLLVAYTRGANGSLLLHQGRFVEQAAIPVTVRDTVGAGDSFTAVVTVGLLAGWPVSRIIAVAAEVAAYVCSKPGATPPMPPHFTEQFR